MAADEAATNGGNDSASASPKCKVKFMCSYGGKILPRPLDGQLKYTGGETRMVSIPRDISFSDLTKKLSELREGDMVLKYQIAPEDLDSLVSVRSDQDLKHMLEEYDRHENGTTPRLRTFLFPSNPIAVGNCTISLEPHAIEQRYIDAINGIIRTRGKLQPLRTRDAGISKSACSSPDSTSPEGKEMDSNKNGHNSITRVRSFPNMCCLDSQHSQSGFLNQNQTQNQHRHHRYQNHQRRHLCQRYPVSSTPQDHSSGHERLSPWGSASRSVMSNLPSRASQAEMGRNPLNSLYVSSRHYLDPGVVSHNHRYYDEAMACSVPHSPRKESGPVSPNPRYYEAPIPYSVPHSPRKAY